MLINRHTLAQELLALDLLPRAAIVDGGFRVQERFGRNRVFAVEIGGRPTYLVKQAIPSHASWRNQTLLREAHCLQFASENPELQRHVPPIRHVDARFQLIIQGFVPGINLAGAIFPAFDAERSTAVHPAELARAIGRTLAKVHRQMRPLNSDCDPAGSLPWVLSPANAWQADRLRSGSPLTAFAAVMKKFHEIQEQLIRLGTRWQPRAWIHHDMKLNNGILADPVDPASTQVVFIDWELAGPGDPAWDVAGIMHSYFGRAILDQDRREAATEAKQPDPGGTILADAQNLCSATCDGYLDEVKTEEADFRDRSLAYTGARLIQLASEYVSDRGAINSTILFLLQAGSNLLSDPRSFRQFAGLPE